MSDTWYFVLVCVVMVIATSITRGTLFVLPSRWKLPHSVDSALRFAPACALSAIIVPAVLTSHGRFVADAANPRLWAVLAGGFAYTRKRSMLVMICVGMSVFTVMRLLTE